MLFIVIFILSLASGFIFTWWVGAIIAFAAALYAGKTPLQAFLSGFAAIALVWMVLALFKSIPNNHILAGRVAKMIQLPNWVLVLFVTMIIGGIVGGLSSLSGLLVKRMFANEKKITRKNHEG